MADILLHGHDPGQGGALSAPLLLLDQHLFISECGVRAMKSGQLYRWMPIFAWCLDRLIEVEMHGTTSANIVEIFGHGEGVGKLDGQPSS